MVIGIAVLTFLIIGYLLFCFLYLIVVGSRYGGYRLGESLRDQRMRWVQQRFNNHAEIIHIDRDGIVRAIPKEKEDIMMSKAAKRRREATKKKRKE